MLPRLFCSLRRGGGGGALVAAWRCWGGAPRLEAAPWHDDEVAQGEARGGGSWRGEVAWLHRDEEDHRGFIGGNQLVRKCSGDGRRASLQ